MPEESVEAIHIVYHGFDRKACEVEVDGTWYDAELRSWDRDEHGHWSGIAAWTEGPGRSSRLDRFPEERIRAGPVDDARR